MKTTDIFNKAGILFLAGAFAFTFSSCDTGTNNEQVAEEEVETEELDESQVNYEAYEEEEMDGTAQAVYEPIEEYNYQERERVIDRVRNELQLAENSLERLEEKIETEGDEVSQEALQEWKSLREDLQESRQQLDEQLQELNATSEQNWERVRNETQEYLNEFEEDWEALKERNVVEKDFVEALREYDLIKTETGTGAGEETGAGMGTGVKTTGSTTVLEDPEINKEEE